MKGAGFTPRSVATAPAPDPVHAQQGSLLSLLGKCRNESFRNVNAELNLNSWRQVLRSVARGWIWERMSTAGALVWLGWQRCRTRLLPQLLVTPAAVPATSPEHCFFLYWRAHPGHHHQSSSLRFLSLSFHFCEVRNNPDLLGVLWWWKVIMWVKHECPLKRRLSVGGPCWVEKAGGDQEKKQWFLHCDIVSVSSQGWERRLQVVRSVICLGVRGRETERYRNRDGGDFSAVWGEKSIWLPLLLEAFPGCSAWWMSPSMWLLFFHLFCTWWCPQFGSQPIFFSPHTLSVPIHARLCARDSQSSLPSPKMSFNLLCPTPCCPLDISTLMSPRHIPLSMSQTGQLSLCP